MTEEKAEDEKSSEVANQPSVAGSVLHKLIFLNWVQFPPLPRVPDLSDPAAFTFKSDSEDFDTSNISHLFLSCPGGGKIGAWYMLPPQSSGRWSLSPAQTSSSFTCTATATTDPSPTGNHSPRC